MKLRDRDQILRRTKPAFRRISTPSANPLRARIVPTPYRRPAIALASRGLLRGADTNPYVDFGNYLTADGGFLFSYKDVDPRLRYALWRVFAWLGATGGEAWYVLTQFLLHHPVANWLLIAAVAIVNFLIVRSPIAINRWVEIRQDCMIVDRTDLFWLKHMDAGWPSFQDDGTGNKMLAGIYGTRFVEFFTVLRFDDCDRAPEVLAQHLTRAMQQLWTLPPELI